LAPYGTYISLDEFSDYVNRNPMILQVLQSWLGLWKFI
jgi:hypothetical protein